MSDNFFLNTNSIQSNNLIATALLSTIPFKNKKLVSWKLLANLEFDVFKNLNRIRANFHVFALLRQIVTIFAKLLENKNFCDEKIFPKILLGSVRSWTILLSVRIFPWALGHWSLIWNGKEFVLLRVNRPLSLQVVNCHDFRWGWLGFNCGSTYGVAGGKWKLAAK